MLVKALDQCVVAVLMGGNSSEREVSLMSGVTIVDNLVPVCAQVRAIDPADSNWLAHLDGVDFVFNILHGGAGENGSVQGLLATLGVPQSGSGVLGAALGMDKLRSKAIWRDAGLPVAEAAVLTSDTDFEAVIQTLGDVFVKPAFEGSSIGMSIASSAEELAEAYANASVYQGPVFAERRIVGEEYTVAILGDRALPAIRLQATETFYDYHAKYVSNDTQYFCPCGLSAQREAELADLALAAFKAIDCAVWGRVDFMVDQQGQPYILEANTVPGMTSHSLVPMAAKAAGLSLQNLLSQIIELSLARAGVHL
ncbi:MAG: D-alanine--D-alanine ligase [Halieaceae bacterium]|nr:D-alanine--D-alanine ligase [Halieaceae bacterium]